METKVPVTVSYSRKVNHQLYGGNAYESSDFFCSMAVDAGEDGQASITAAFDECKQAVMQQVGNEIETFQGGLPSQEFTDFIYAYAANRLKDVEVFKATVERMSTAQKAIVDSMRRGRATAKRDLKV